MAWSIGQTAGALQAMALEMSNVWGEWPFRSRADRLGSGHQSWPLWDEDGLVDWPKGRCLASNGPGNERRKPMMMACFTRFLPSDASL